MELNFYIILLKIIKNGKKAKKKVKNGYISKGEMGASNPPL
jgi:hypothetical protein